jgi:hypothetical protein
MKSLIANHNLAIGLTLAALLSEMWRGFLDAMFVLPVDFAEPSMMQLAAVIFTVLFGGWGVALAFAWRGSQSAMIINFGLNLLVLIAIPISWLFIYCTADCRAGAGIFNLANSMNLILGALAAVSVGIQVFTTSKEVKGESEGAFDAA